jgi:replicative DNA helicase
MDKEIILKLPPQSLELEKTVLGALMVESHSFIQVSDILSEQTFYKAEHKAIFKSIIDLHSKSQNVDLMTVTENLKKRGALENAGGISFLMDIMNTATSSANVVYHARILKQKELQRSIIDIGNSLIAKGFSDLNDPFEIIDNTSTNLYELVSNTMGKDFVKFDSLVYGRFLKYRQGLKTGMTGIGTGLSELDALTNGFQNNNLIILAARPSMGKTAMALHFIRKAAFEQNLPVAIFSLEMSEEQLSDRIIAAESEVELEALKKFNLRPDQDIKIEDAYTRLIRSNITIDGSSSLTINQIRSKAIRMQQKDGIRMIVVDYLQLMSGSKNKGNREQEISEISRGLKQVAKDLNIPVIALSQLSRQVENRPGGNKRPMLSDLRESGSIEQDADIVMFLYRPEYYGIEQDENGNSTAGLTEIIVAKNRDGGVDIARCNFVGKYQQFKDEENNSFGFTDHTEITNEPNNSLSPSEQW